MQFHEFSCLSVVVLRICNALVIYISGAPRVRDSRDIAGLKCRDFTSDESRQCLFSPPWNRRVKIIQRKVQVGKDQEKAQSERDSHSKNRGGKKPTNNQALIP